MDGQCTPECQLQGLEHSGEHSEEWAKAQSCSASAEIFIQQPKCSVLVHALPKSCTGKCLGGSVTPKYNSGVRGTGEACLYREWVINYDLPFDCTNMLTLI